MKTYTITAILFFALILPLVSGAAAYGATFYYTGNPFMHEWGDGWDQWITGSVTTMTLTIDDSYLKNAYSFTSDTSTINKVEGVGISAGPLNFSYQQPTYNTGYFSSLSLTLDGHEHITGWNYWFWYYPFGTNVGSASGSFFTLTSVGPNPEPVAQWTVADDASSWYGVQGQVAMGSTWSEVPGVWTTSSTVPEPSTMLLYSFGLIGLAGWRLRKRG